MSSDCAIGIDLGTNFVCVGAFINGTVRIIPNEHDKRLTPAYVAFTEEERLFGESAKHQAPLNSENTLHNVKRLIGRKQDNGTQNRINETWGFSIETVDKNRICIPVSYTKNQTKVKETLYPEQVSAMILGRLKKMAEDHLGTKVKKAVVSVPASFDSAQRAATADAGKIAGFERIELISEPTAAAIAYCFDNEVKKMKRIVIVDFGGGFLDISIAVVNKKDIEILATDGGSNIGGEMVDNNIFTHYIKKLKEQNIDWSKSKKDMIRLKEACEKVKRNLSAATRARIPEDLAADLGVESSSLILTRSDFNQLNESLFEKFKCLVEKVFKSDANAEKQIDDIVLVGGSTRLTEIRKILLEYFNVKELNRTINPDEAVAFGAAIYAAKLSDVQESPRYIIHDHNINDGGKVNNKVNTEEEIKRMIDKNKELDEYDETCKQQSNARNNLENTAYSVKLAIKSSDLSEKATKASKECDNALKWLESNKDTKVEDCKEREKLLKSLILETNITPEQSVQNESKMENRNIGEEQPNTISGIMNKPTATEKKRKESGGTATIASTKQETDQPRTDATSEGKNTRNEKNKKNTDKTGVFGKILKKIPSASNSSVTSKGKASMKEKTKQIRGIAEEKKVEAKMKDENQRTKSKDIKKDGKIKQTSFATNCKTDGVDSDQSQEIAPVPEGKDLVKEDTKKDGEIKQTSFATNCTADDVDRNLSQDIAPVPEGKDLVMEKTTKANQSEAPSISVSSKNDIAEKDVHNTNTGKKPNKKVSKNDTTRGSTKTPKQKGKKKSKKQRNQL